MKEKMVVYTFSMFQKYPFTSEFFTEREDNVVLFKKEVIYL